MRARSGVLAIAALALLVPASSHTAAAQGENHTIIDPTHGNKDDLVRISGRNPCPGAARVDIQVANYLKPPSSQGWETKAAADGSWSIRVRAFANVAPGRAYLVRAYCYDSDNAMFYSYIERRSVHVTASVFYEDGQSPPQPRPSPSPSPPPPPPPSPTPPPPSPTPSVLPTSAPMTPSPSAEPSPSLLSLSPSPTQASEDPLVLTAEGTDDGATLVPVAIGAGSGAALLTGLGYVVARRRRRA